MALEDKENKDDGSNSSSDDEVTPEQAEILEMLEQNSRELKPRIRCWRRQPRSCRS